MLKTASILLAVLILYSCDDSNKEDSKTDKEVFETDHAIEIDTVVCAVNLFSIDGYFRIVENEIVYVQASIENTLWFDEDGNYRGEKLGSGYGPAEANGDLMYHGFMPNGNNLFLGSNYIFKIFTSDLEEIKKKVNFTWASRQSLYNTDELIDPSMYDFHYRDEPFIDSQWLPVINNMAVIPVNINDYINPVANLTKKPEAFFGSAYTIGLVDLETGVLKRVFRKHSEPFTNNKWLYFYNFPYRATSGTEIFVSDRLGPFIDVFDTEGNLQGRFGEEGRFLNRRLDTYKSYEDFLSALGIETTLQYSYYTHIFYDKSKDFVFRSYHIKNLNEWGLQVYDDQRQLIFDQLVPFRFNVIGKIDDYYYADGLKDEENNKLAIYRFRLPN